MAGYIAIGLLLVFFVFSLFTKKIEARIEMPYAFVALAVFFLVNAIYGKGMLFGNAFFFVMAIILAAKSYRKIKEAN
jgi:hypothetical protein